MKKDPHRTLDHAHAHLIPELISAIQNFVAHRARPPEGIMIEARQLANRFKFKGRPLFDSFTPELTQLLAAFFAAVRPDHDVLESIRRHFPEELEKLSRQSRHAVNQCFNVVSRIAASRLLFLAQFLETWIIPQRIKHGIEPKQGRSKRHVFVQRAVARHREQFL